MRKLFLYPVWNLKRVELYLDGMEEKGYRLDHVSFRYIFSFKEIIPQKCQYALVYTFVKEYDIQEYAYKLRKEHGANIIPSYHSSSIDIYRITDPHANLVEFLKYRKHYLKRIIYHKIVFWLFLTICSFGGIRSPFALCFWSLMIISIVINAQNIVGLFYLLFEKSE